ncbi:hypothetical protein BTJ44_02293 [Bacillus mycoides]|nr:hypothetical protein BTJ44_02293 [Bacillus mycoides]OSY09480.1 hypothetical protein BTJ48_02101 [Bacillus mycoides]
MSDDKRKQRLQQSYQKQVKRIGIGQELHFKNVVSRYY